MQDKRFGQGENIQDNKKKSPAWDLFWQEHGQELMNEENSQKNPGIIKNNNIGEEHSSLKGKKKDIKNPEDYAQKEEKEKQLPSRTFSVSAKESEGEMEGTLGGKKAKSLSLKGKTILVLLGCVLVLAGAVLGSAYLFKQKLADEKAIISATIEEKFSELAEANQLALEDINQRMAAIDGQMSEIIAILESTDQAILSSGAANREAMAKRIEELDKQLANLKKSLNILMESKGAQ